MGTSLYDQFQKEQSTPVPQGPTKPPKVKAVTAEPSLYDQFRQESADDQPSGTGDTFRGHGASGTFGEPTSSVSRFVNGLGTSVGQGLTGGFADELNARLEPGDYNQNLLVERAGEKAFQQRHPATDFAGKVAGGIGTMAMLPEMSAAKAGAAYGALSGAGNATAGHRTTGAAIGAATGALTGKLAEKAALIARAKFGAPTPGANVLSREAEMGAADATNYAAAGAEGSSAVQAGQVPQAVTDILNDPDVKPYADMLRGTRQLKNADEPTLLRETYKLMSREQGGLLKRMATAGGYDAKLAVPAENIALVKQDMLNAADQLGPSFRRAVEEHAANAGELDAMTEGTDIANRAVRGSHIKGSKLGTLSKEAIIAGIKGMRPNEAAAQAQGMLGEIQPQLGVSANPRTLFGALPASKVTGAIAPYINALDQRAGNTAQRGATNILTANGVTNMTDYLKQLGVLGQNP